MNLAAFRVSFPECKSVDDTMAQTYLDAAAVQLDAPYWGTYFDRAHGLLAAHMLATSPYGMTARLVSEKGDSTYGKAFRAMREEVTFADRVF